MSGIPAAVKSLLASSSIIPTILNGNVAVVAIELTLSAPLALPVLVEPVRAEVPNEALAKTAVNAVARSVRVASEATLNS